MRRQGIKVMNKTPQEIFGLVNAIEISFKQCVHHLHPSEDMMYRNEPVNFGKTGWPFCWVIYGP